MEEMKIGKLVQANLAQLFQHCSERDPEELVKLSELSYSKATFGISYTVLRTPTEIFRDGMTKKYYVQVHDVLGHQFRVTSQWTRKHLPAFVFYLVELGLEPVGLTPEQVDKAIAAHLPPHGGHGSSIGGARYRKVAIGVAQNAVVRHVLGSLGHESFKAQDVLHVKREFDFSCAYCGSQRQLVVDHAVPINLTSLGEHKLGNLVPACNACNSAKGDKVFDVFLRETGVAGAEWRIAAINDHLARHGYEPLIRALAEPELEQVRSELTALRKLVATGTAATVSAINELFAQNRRSR